MVSNYLLCYLGFSLSLSPSASENEYSHSRWHCPGMSMSSRRRNRLFLWARADSPALNWPDLSCKGNGTGSDKSDLPLARESYFLWIKDMGNKCRLATTLALSISLFSVLVFESWEEVPS